MSVPLPGPRWMSTAADAQSPSQSWLHRDLPLVPANGQDGLTSTDSQAYVLAETLLVGGRRLNQHDFPQHGAAGGETLIGRRGELATIRGLIERARTDGEACLVFGEPGVGKTVLLNAFEDRAESEHSSAITTS